MWSNGNIWHLFVLLYLFWETNLTFSNSILSLLLFLYENCWTSTLFFSKHTASTEMHYLAALLTSVCVDHWPSRVVLGFSAHKGHKWCKFCLTETSNSLKTGFSYIPARREARHPEGMNARVWELQCWGRSLTASTWCGGCAWCGQWWPPQTWYQVHQVSDRCYPACSYKLRRTIHMIFSIMSMYHSMYEFLIK